MTKEHTKTEAADSQSADNDNSPEAPHADLQALMRKRVAAKDNRRKTLKEFNARYALIKGGRNAGKVADLSNAAAGLILLPRTAFINAYEGDEVTTRVDNDGRATTKNKALWWLSRSDKHTYEDFIFAPPGDPRHGKEPKGVCNLWRGYAVEPKKGDGHKPLLKHLYANVEEPEWFLKWLAHLVKCPGDKPGTAVALPGEPGSGKTVFYVYLECIFGSMHAMPLTSPEQLVGRFNAHLARRVLLGVEEGFWAGDKKAEATLKQRITGLTSPLELKNCDVTVFDDRTHYLITSNSEWVVPVASDDRRFAVLQVQPDYKDDDAFWAEVHSNLDERAANLLYFLLNEVDYQPQELRRPPSTKARVKQQLLSLTGVKEWWLEVLLGSRDPSSVDDMIKGSGLFGRVVSKDSVFEDYESWAQSKKLRHPKGSNVFWRELRQIASIEDRRPNGVYSEWFPEIDACREKFAAHLGTVWPLVAAVCEGIPD